MKILLTGILTFFVTALCASPVSIDRAKSVAESLLGKNTQKSTSVIELKYVGLADGDTAYYVFSFADGGFAIISADDVIVPVLGYSQTSDAGDIVENQSLLFQLNRYCQAISELKKIGNVPSSVQEKWEMFAEDASYGDEGIVEVGPLLTSRWGQGDYYNDSCPSSFVGCVAVAMGQVMRYHNWPKQGRGWHEYIPHENPECGAQFVNFGNTAYRWDIMPDKLRSNHNNAEKSAVAQLLYHVGVAVNMSYNDDGSGAYTSDVLPALVNNFRYSKNLRICSLSNYNVKDWFALISGEIDAGRPVIYSGATKKNEGHAWIVDGYKSDGYLHVNWGWDGDYDGYFYVDNMNLGTMAYSEEIDAIVGIEPDINAPMLWALQSTNFTSANLGINNISVVDKSTAWASSCNIFDGHGQAIDFCRTTNGGEYWESGKVDFYGYRNYTISSICGVSADEAWASVYVSAKSRTRSGGKIVHTTDGGSTWQEQGSAKFEGSDAFPNMVYFWDANNGVCIGDPNNGYFEIYTTIDGGENWKRVPSSRIPANRKDETGVVNCCCVFDDNVYFSTTEGRLFRSVDRGATWTVVSTPLASYFNVAFKDAQTGVISGIVADTLYASRTFDGGETWEKLDAGDKFYSAALAYVPGTDTLLSVGLGISYSVDDGETFTNYADFYSDIDMYTSIGVSPDGKGMWVGALNSIPQLGGMWHRGVLDVKRHIVSISDISVPVDLDVRIYPNPTNGILFVEYENTIEKVDVVSVVGMVLKSQVVEACKATIDLQKVPNGVYVVRVYTESGIVSKRVIIN